MLKASPQNLYALTMLDPPVFRCCSRCMELRQCYYHRPESQKAFCVDCAQALEKKRRQYLGLDAGEVLPAPLEPPPPPIPIPVPTPIPTQPATQYAPRSCTVRQELPNPPAVPRLRRSVNLAELQDWLVAIVVKHPGLSVTAIKQQLLKKHGFDMSFRALQMHLELLQIQNKIVRKQGANS